MIYSVNSGLYRSFLSAGKARSDKRTLPTGPAKGGASGGGKASNAEMDSSVIIAGDVVSVRAYGYDQYGNAASMGGVDGESGGKDKSSTAKQLVGYEGDSTGRELSAKLVAPDGTEAPLSVALQAKSGKPATYDIRAETMLSGRHEVHVLLDKVPIRNSPATFVVLPSAATPHHSRLIPPANGVDNLVASLHDPAIVVLATHDKFANALASGGLRVAGRLNLVKQSASDISILTPNNNTVTIEDRNDGTYAIKVALDMTAVVKLIVNMDKDLAGSGGELPAMQLSFVKPKVAAEPA